MKLQKGLLLAVMGVATLFLSACGTKAPDLSFEETLAAYEQSGQAVKEILSLMTNPELVTQSVTK